MSLYFAKPFGPIGGDIDVKVDLSNYATKTGFKNISHIDTSTFALNNVGEDCKNTYNILNINENYIFS